eukprot:Rhum_TRINITY_DN23113_c0_g1::Rhum_TRINITY_DN23113_c0_g1_i1::g.177189::m.177189
MFIVDCVRLFSSSSSVFLLLSHPSSSLRRTEEKQHAKSEKVVRNQSLLLTTSDDGLPTLASVLLAGRLRVAALPLCLPRRVAVRRPLVLCRQLRLATGLVDAVDEVVGAQTAKRALIGHLHDREVLGLRELVVLVHVLLRQDLHDDLLHQHARHGEKRHTGHKRLQELDEGELRDEAGLREQDAQAVAVHEVRLAARLDLLDDLVLRLGDETHLVRVPHVVALQTRRRVVDQHQEHGAVVPQRVRHAQVRRRVRRERAALRRGHVVRAVHGGAALGGRRDVGAAGADPVAPGAALALVLVGNHARVHARVRLGVEVVCLTRLDREGSSLEEALHRQQVAEAGAAVALGSQVPHEVLRRTVVLQEVEVIAIGHVEVGELQVGVVLDVLRRFAVHGVRPHHREALDFTDVVVQVDVVDLIVHLRRRTHSSSACGPQLHACAPLRVVQVSVARRHGRRRGSADACGDEQGAKLLARRVQHIDLVHPLAEKLVAVRGGDDGGVSAVAGHGGDRGVDGAADVGDDGALRHLLQKVPLLQDRFVDDDVDEDGDRDQDAGDAETPVADADYLWCLVGKDIVKVKGERHAFSLGESNEVQIL